MFIDFVTYLEIRDDLSKEDEQYINSEIERYMAKYEMKKDDVLVCEGHSEHCFLNTEGNLINLKREYPEFYNTLTSLVGGEEC